MIREAEAELIFQSPCLIYDGPFRRDLARARRRHPDLRRPSMEPVPPRHPDFHERYEDVGLFPGLDDRAIQRQVQIIRAMGGWSRPLL